MPFKSSDNMDQGIKKKLRRLDGCAVPIENDSVEGDAGGFSHDTSQSLGNEINGLRDENNGSIRDEKQLKRERRKQANRESARRSRLRKQAEVEELMTRYESLNMENTALKTELDQLQEDSEKLRLENAELMEKLKNTQVGQQEGMVSAKD